MLLVWKPPFENYCSGVEILAQFCGWRRGEAWEGNPAGLVVLRTLRCFCMFRLKSPQPNPNPWGPPIPLVGALASPLICMPLSPVPLLPGAAPRSLLVCGSDGPAPASVLRQRWRLPLLHWEQWLRLGGGLGGHWQEHEAVILGHLLSYELLRAPESHTPPSGSAPLSPSPLGPHTWKDYWY